MITIIPGVELVENIPARMVVVIIPMKVAGAAVDAALNLVLNLLIDAETEAKPQNLLKQHIYLNYGA
jgi:hypothetical protein